jgi:hypothetical protein
MRLNVKHPPCPWNHRLLFAPETGRAVPLCSSPSILHENVSCLRGHHTAAPIDPSFTLHAIRSD